MVSVGVMIPCHPAHNERLYNAIDSASEADQIMVVLDGEQDAPRIPSDLNAKVLTIKLFESSGVVRARNIGISHMSTDLIIPLDADDYFINSGIGLLADAWQPGTFTYGTARVREGSEGLRRRRGALPGMIEKKNVCQATMCFHRIDWLRVGGYNPRYDIGMEDWAFQLALNKAGVKPKRIDRVVYHYSSGGMRHDFKHNKRLIVDMLRDDYGIKATV